MASWFRSRNSGSRLTLSKRNPARTWSDFRVHDGEITSLEFLESKLRTGTSVAAAEQAHSQLVADKGLGFGDILEFVAERLEERGSVLYEAMLRHLEQRDPDDGQACTYGIFLVWDESAWDEEVLERLHRVESLLQPLHVRVAHLSELADLVSDVYDRIGIEAKDDGT